ncbi:MAG: hypothetical protein IKP32_04015 [Clostridia bacterium]|nr:hypothetical protein [Clostridia bacterium]
MKKVLTTVFTVLSGLLLVSVFVVPIVRGIMYKDERSAMLIAVGVLALFASLAIYGIKHTAHIRQKATAQTSGIITRAKKQLAGDEYDTDNGWRLRISYRVDQQEYQITKYIRLKFGTNAKQYVNRSVTVHYDPNDPKTAWAEFPWEQSK